MPPTVAAGALAGAVALVAFAAVHAMWITPIWGMLAMLPVAALVGALAAWPFDLGARALPPAPLDGIAVGGVLLLALLPTVVHGTLAGPLDQQHITWQGLLVPLLLAAPAGGLIGMLITGSAAAAGSLALATTAYALTLGHNLPFFPLGSPGAGKAIVLVALPTLAAALAFSSARVLLAAATLGTPSR